MQPRLSRRAILAATAGLPPLASAAWAQAASGLRVGGLTVTPLLDGVFPLALGMIPAASNPEGEALLAGAGLPRTGPAPLPVNAFAVMRGDRAWLLDAGSGTVLGPDLGKVPAALTGMGLDPARVEAVLLTHLHADHASGVTLPGGFRVRHHELTLYGLCSSCSDN